MRTVSVAALQFPVGYYGENEIEKEKTECSEFSIREFISRLSLKNK